MSGVGVRYFPSWNKNILILLKFKVFLYYNTVHIINTDNIKGAKMIIKSGLIEQSSEGKRIVMTTDSVDREGDVVVTTGIDIKQFKSNNILLWMHNPNQPIGTVVDIKRTAKKMTGVPTFDNVTETSKMVKNLYDKDTIKASSIGFIPKEWISKWQIDPRKIDDETQAFLDKYADADYILTKTELLELSLVTIPANQDAVALGLDNAEIDFINDSKSDYVRFAYKNIEDKQKMMLEQLNKSMNDVKKAMQGLDKIDEMLNGIKSLESYFRNIENEKKIKNLTNQLRGL